MLAPILGLTDCSIMLVSISPLVSIISRDFLRMDVSIAFIVWVSDNEIFMLFSDVIFM